jgi:probable selenium-dependent hydroxylase accessory protein YqeC
VKFAGALFGDKIPRCAAFVGGGGKTTAIRTLASELADVGRKVVITTTTKMLPPEDPAIFAHTVGEAERILRRSDVVWAGVGVYCDNVFKMQGVDGALPALCALGDCVLVEADGARAHPLKMIDAAYEPQIPPQAEFTAAVAGLDGIGRTVAQAVHRPELACEALGVEMEHIVTPEDVAKLLRICYAPDVVLLNKADDVQKKAAAEAVARYLPDVRCVIWSLRGTV